MWQQFNRLNPSVYSAALRGGCCVPPCVADVIVNCAVCQQFNKGTLLLLLLLFLNCSVTVMLEAYRPYVRGLRLPTARIWETFINRRLSRTVQSNRGYWA